MAKQIKWIDFGKEGLRLRYFQDKKSSKTIYILSASIRGALVRGSDEWNACCNPKIGFRPSPTGRPILLLEMGPSKALKLADILPVYPNARYIQVDPASVRMDMESKERMTPEETAQMAALNIASMVGTNALNQRVYETPTGVRFRIDNGGERIEEDEIRPGFVLRAKDDNLAICAHGFVLGLMSNGHAASSDVMRFVNVIYGPGSADDKDLVERVSQTIEAEMSRRLREKFGVAGDGAYRDAQSLYENSPNHQGAAKGDGAVPLPLAVAVQEMVRAYGGDDQNSIYVPQLFDGAMASMLGSYDIFTEKVDAESREGKMRALIPASLKKFEREDNEKVPPHPISILNVESNTELELAVLRESLLKRNPLGFSVMLIPAINDGTELGIVASKTRSSEFLKQLQTDYDVMNIATLQPIMRSKMGVGSPMIVVAVGRKLTDFEKQLRVDTFLVQKSKQLYDWDALRSFTNDTLVKVHEAAGHKLTATQERDLRANESTENSYQLPYQAFSKRTGKKVELMIPRNLAGATYKALQNLSDKVGNIDEYLQNTIGFDDEQYGYLVPEQIDAGALMVAAIDRGKGFVLGDQTGAGKGVTIALAVAYAWNRGMPVVFVTKQDNLFSDFYRDLKKTGLHKKMRPMVMNHTSTIVDQLSPDLDKIHSGISRKEFLQNFRFGLNGFDNPNIVFTTYSQFNSGGDSEKSAFLKAIAPESLVIFDESHLASGDTSNLGEVCKVAADTAKAVVYSSATWLKDARQVGFYDRALPESVNAQMVSDAMQAGGENIQEVFSAMLAEDGIFIRRERDGSALTIDAVTDTVRLRENESVANNVSLILQGLQRLCGVTDQVGRRLTRTQMEKLDRAQFHIRRALDRAAQQVQLSRRALQAQPARGEEIAQVEHAGEFIDETLMEMEEADQALQLSALLRARDGNNHAAMYGLENEEIIETGQATHAFDAVTDYAEQEHPERAEEDANEGEWAGQALVSLDAISYADLGLTEVQFNDINRDIANIGADETAEDRLKKELTRIRRLVSNVSTRTTAFGSMLFLTQRTLNVALQARFATERAIEKIRNGQKPIIFLEQTFEKRLAEALEDPNAVKNDDGTVSIRPLTLKDNLRETFRAVVNMRHVNAEGKLIEGTIMDSGFMANEAEREAVQEGLKELENMINTLPDDLYCSPLDTIICGIRKAGYTVAEATGRKHQVVDMEDDVWRVRMRTKHESSISTIERGFNFGEFDALVGNKAMSTGLSLHASAEFADQRQRAMMFIQIFADVNDYIQAIGRGDRRGQIIGPLLEMLASGLPSEARIMMNHYDKLRKLLASTTSNRSSKFETGELPDLFNSVGDRSVRDYLQSNPATATRLGISFDKYMPTHLTTTGAENEVQTTGLASHVVSRLDLLPVNESRMVYAELAHNFDAVIAELDEMGINPLRTNVLDYSKHESAVISNVENLLPAALNARGEVSSVFDEAVELQTISIRDTRRARSWEETLETIENETHRMADESSAARKAGKTPDFVPDTSVTAIYSAQDANIGPVRRAIKMVPSGLRDRVEKQFDAMKIMMTSSNLARETADVVAPGPEQNQTGRVTAIDLPGQGMYASQGAGTHGASVGNVPLTPLQVIDRRKQWLLSNLPFFMPGQYVSVRARNFNWNFVSNRGVVTDLTLPPKGRETNLARWVVHIQFPGYQEAHRYTLHDLYKENLIGLNQWLPAEEEIRDGLVSHSVPDAFGNYEEANYTSRRYVLVGNQFRGASIAASKHLGAGGVLQMKNETPRRVISLRRGLTKDEIYEAVPVEMNGEASVHLFSTAYALLNQPPRKQMETIKTFLGGSLENRGIHSSRDMRDIRGGVSLYWMPTKQSITEALEDGADTEERAEARALSSQDNVNLLSGIGLRVSKQNFHETLRDEFLVQVTEDLGPDVIRQMPGRAGSATMRFVVRFKNAEGERDTDAVAKTKIAAVARAASQVFKVDRYVTYSSLMRNLAMDSTATQREQLRVVQQTMAAEEMMRLQMMRMPQQEQQEALHDMDDQNDDDQGEAIQNAA